MSAFDPNVADDGGPRTTGEDDGDHESAGYGWRYCGVYDAGYRRDVVQAQLKG